MPLTPSPSHPQCMYVPIAARRTSACPSVSLILFFCCASLCWLLCVDVQFLVWLSECVALPSERHNRESSIPLEAARLLLNLTIINADTVQVTDTRRSHATAARELFIDALCSAVRQSLTLSPTRGRVSADRRMHFWSTATVAASTTCCEQLRSTAKALSNHSQHVDVPALLFCSVFHSL